MMFLTKIIPKYKIFVKIFVLFKNRYILWELEVMLNKL